MIVLLSALILAFLASVSSELTTSQTYANGATVKQLADSATQLVISQVVSGTGNTNSTLAWASQPGMIRTYDTSGNPALFYKLYSSRSLIANAASTTFKPADEVPPVDWDSANKSALYTDLNSPVTRSGTTYFPILDPRALTASSSTSVEGFTYTKTVNQVALPSDSGGVAGQRLPMPVLWLYVLQNGTLATPISGTGGTVTFDSTDATKVPSRDNPIVGRIAYWTDDETCKININTASEGTFWDRPWAHTGTEEKYSTAVPAQNEYQRYPGHPSKTSLSPVLGPILSAPVSWYFGIPSTTQAANTNALTAYYSLSPRISPGGTMGGIIDDTGTDFKAIAAKADRLYTSPDELFYSPTLTSGARQQNSVWAQASSGLTVPLNNGFLEKAKFFLTAHSRAPEVNLFGKPRLSLWPIQMNTGLRNAKDALLAFCSTINGKAYYFQRQNVYTSFGVASSSQDQLADWTATDASGETRNQTLYTYLDRLTQQSIPGFGGTFSGKYPDTRRQILTEMFDTIRSGVNTYSNALPTSSSTSGYTYAPKLGDSGEGQIVPLAPATGTAAGTRGFGRFATITSAAIVFYRSNAAMAQTVSGAISPVPIQLTTATADPQIAAALFLQPYTPSPGLPAWSPNVHYVVTGLDQMQISSASTAATKLGFPVSADNWAMGRMCYSGAQNNTAGNTTSLLSFKGFLRYADQQNAGLLGTDSTKAMGLSTAAAPDKSKYPFYSNTTTASPPTGVALKASDSTFDFLGTPTPIQIKIYSDNNGAIGQLLQTINMNFPAVTGLPMPTTAASSTTVANTEYQYGARWAAGSGSTTYQTKKLRQVLFSFQDVNSGRDSAGVIVASRTMDVVRGIQPDPNGPAKGDLRVYAALPVVPSSYFTTSPNYDTGSAPKVAISHALRDGAYAGSYINGNQQYGWDQTTAGTGGIPVSAPTYPYALMHVSQLAGNLVPKLYLATGTTSLQKEYLDGFNPIAPFGLDGAFQTGGAAGDWDNMTGSIEDGPYINKPDEGNSDTVSNLANSAGDFVSANGGNTITGGYFSRGANRTTGFDYRATTGTTFSPNRQVASGVMFGSLPTGIDPTGVHTPQPWQTLLFCANPAAGTSHPGWGTPLSGPPYTTPADHLVLDLFTMPIVEPYAISEPLSTAGKVNLNYQILPFTYITRDTAVRAVLKSTRIMAIPTSASTQNVAATKAYKDGSAYPYECRFNINPDESTGTLKGFESRFSGGDIFRSASEICGIYLVPQKIANATYPTGLTVPASYSDVAAWWDTGGAQGTGFRLTGDNTREAPYGDIYPRLTTKSNTYTVHVRVQTLKKVTGTSTTQWIEGTDQVTGEYRGSSLIERYVDTSDPTLPDFTATGTASVEGYYKIRIVNAKRFEP